MMIAGHVRRLVPLLAFAVAMLAWACFHTEVTFADGLRYIRHAERIDRDGLDAAFGTVDHPAHPLALAAAHKVVGGEGPVAWQRSAQVAAFAAGVLLVVPVYLLGLELFGATAAWIGALLMASHHLTGFVVVNVLSESTFLVFWTFGLWCALRFLREGRLAWLPPTIAFAGSAYLTRPEGLLLPAALVATLLLCPVLRATRMAPRRWLAATAALVVGPLVVAGPYMAARGGIGTKPAFARVLGLEEPAAADALERDRPLDPGQTSSQAYAIAARRVAKVTRHAVTNALLPFALLGLFAARRSVRPRVWLFLSIVFAASAFGLMRLHLTGGYCTSRHALIPALLLILAGGHGIGWALSNLKIEGRRLGLGDGPLELGPAVWALVIGGFVVIPQYLMMTPKQGCFAPYREAGLWLSEHARGEGKVLDLTNWSLYFSDREGYAYADVNPAADDPATRWVVARTPHIEGSWAYAAKVRNLVAGRDPVASLPVEPAPGQVQIFIFDRTTAPAARSASLDDSKADRR